MSSANYFNFLIKLDEDDPELSIYESYLKDYQYVQNVDLCISVSNSLSKIDAINRDVQLAIEWDVICNVSDDQRFTVKGFDDIIRQHCDRDTFVHFPDSYKRASCSTMSIMGRDYYDRTKQVYNPGYYSLWADVEATEVAKLLGCYKYVPKMIFEHIHYSTGAPMDDLYRRNNTYKADRAIYMNRRTNNFGLGERDPFLLIKYATRGRWRQFFAAIDNIYATIRTNQFKILVSADLDDVEMNCPEVIEFCKRYHNVELSYGYHSNKVNAINAGFNPLTQWKWCVNMSDDMTFVEPGWDYKMLEQIRSVWQTGWDWFAHFNDGFVADLLPTLNVCGRDYYNRFHYIYHPSYKSVSCDAENMFVAQMLGRYAYFEDIYFHHDHPSNLKQPSDYIYRRNHDYGEADTVNYFERLRRLFEVKSPVLIPEQIKPYL